MSDPLVRTLGALVGLIALGIAYQQLGRWRDRRRFPPPGDMVDVGGHRLHTRCAGAGGPVVLLDAAVAASSLSWVVVQPRLAALTRVCAYDRAGLGWSDSPSDRRSVDRIVDELGTLLDHATPHAPGVLVGHSFGALVVRAFAARRPERVAGLVLIDPPIEWLVLTRERRRVLRAARYFAQLGAWLAHAGVVRLCLFLLTGGAPQAPRRFVRVFGPTAAHTLERIVGEVRKLPSDVHPLVQALWCQPKCFQAMADHFHALEQVGASAATRELSPSIPVTVNSSGARPAGERAAQRALAAASRLGRHVVATQSGHWVQFDEPEVVCDAVADLVRSARGP